MTATAISVPKTAARESKRERRRRGGWGNAGLLGPFLIFYLLFLVGPLVYDVVLSFFNASLVKGGVLSTVKADELGAQVATEMAAAVTFAVNSPFPKLESALDNVYA